MRFLLAPFLCLALASPSLAEDSLLCPDGRTIATATKGSQELREKTANLNLVETPASFGDLPGWSSHSDPATLRTAMTSNCRTRKLPAGWDRLCPQLDQVSDGELYRFIEANFTPYRLAVNDDNSGLFTSYYASLVNVSKTRSDSHRHPIYRVSDRALKLSRNQVNAGALPHSEVLYWGDNAFDVYVLAVQGSGVGRLPDGRRVKILYGGKNRENYVSLGKVLGECGELERSKISLPAIRTWVENATPEAYQRLISNNQSYVFFREEAYNGEGPLGSLGVPLTPMRSLAVDRRYIPLGTLMYISVDHPLDGSRIEQAVVAQDTGGAINGGLRADIFAGEGEDAGRFAGHMDNRGHFWVLKPK